MTENQTLWTYVENEGIWLIREDQLVGKIHLNEYQGHRNLDEDELGGFTAKPIAFENTVLVGTRKTIEIFECDPESFSKKLNHSHNWDRMKSLNSAHSFTSARTSGNVQDFESLASARVQEYEIGQRDPHYKEEEFSHYKTIQARDKVEQIVVNETFIVYLTKREIVVHLRSDFSLDCYLTILLKTTDPISIEISCLDQLFVQMDGKMSVCQLKPSEHSDLMKSY